MTPPSEKQVRLATETARWAPYVDRLIDAAKVLKDDPHALSYILDEDGNEHLLDLDPYDPLQEAKNTIKEIDLSPPHDDSVLLALYQSILKVTFGTHVDLPTRLG